jgi:hypothetical protein
MMSKRKLSISLGVFMLMAALMFTFSPLHAGKVEAANATVAFANANWNCATAACTSRVKAGQGQKNYQCAEFAARSLAASGYIPGLSTKSSQSAYENYKPGNGKTYDLLAITPSVAAPRGTIATFLTTYGYFKNMGESMSDAEPGDLVAMGNNAHIVVIVSTNHTVASTLIDAHNDARYHVSLSNELSGFTGSWYLLHIQTGA